MYYEGHKIRIYPTEDQIELFWKHVGACRYIWNYMLDLQERIHGIGGAHLSSLDMMKVMQLLKKEEDHKWLYDVSNTSLKNTCIDLEESYKRFFKGVCGLPDFRSKKRSKPSYPVSNERFYFKDKNLCQIQKVGLVKYKTDKQFPIGNGACKFSNVRVSNNNGKWYLSFSIARENQAYELTDKSMGIDLGVKELAVVSCGGEKKVFHNINKSSKVKMWESKIRHYDREIARKINYNKKHGLPCNSKNIQKLYDKRKRAFARLTGIRDNYLHQTTHELVSMLPKRVVMEDLDVQGMMKNHHMAKAVQDQKFYEFRRQMEYKCERHGIEFVLADRYFPSSKTCSCCGNIKKDLRLRDRVYICEKCGKEIDRDDNAAINLERYEVPVKIEPISRGVVTPQIKCFQEHQTNVSSFGKNGCVEESSSYRT